jgi:hypothetical protein
LGCGADDRGQVRLGGRLSISHWTQDVRVDAVVVGMDASWNSSAELAAARLVLPIAKLSGRLYLGLQAD